MAAFPIVWLPVARHGGSTRSQRPHNLGQARDGLDLVEIHVDADKGLLLGASDPRRTGSATVGY